MNDERDAVERIEELYRFLQGEVPDGYKIAKKRIPTLTPEQAWTVIWFIQEMHMELPDHIEQCDVCGSIYDSWKEGHCIDDGKPVNFYCGSCEEYHLHEVRGRLVRIKKSRTK